MSTEVTPTYAFPASRNQLQMWLQEETQETGSAYHIATSYRLRGVLDTDALRLAVATVVERHEALRTVFQMTGDGLRQVVLPAVDVPLEITDRPDEGDSIQQLTDRPFDRDSGPLLRTMLVRVAEDEHLFVLVLHHLIADGWSTGLVTTELTDAYGALAAGQEPSLPPVPLQYADYTLWMEEAVPTQAVRRHVEFWREQLADVPAELEMVPDRPRPVVPDLRADSYGFTVPAEVVAELDRLARDLGATLYMVVLSAFEVLLARYSGQERFALGTVTAGRPHGQFAAVVGLFANMLPLRADIGGRPTFRQLVSRVRGHLLDGLAHQDVPFDQLLADLAPPRVPGVPPLVQVTFQLLHRDFTATAVSGGVSFEPVTVNTERMWTELALTAVQNGDGGLSCGLQWATALYDRATIVRMAENFGVLLAGAAQRPDEPVWRLPLISGWERDRLREWGGLPAATGG